MSAAESFGLFTLCNDRKLTENEFSLLHGLFGRQFKSDRRLVASVPQSTDPAAAASREPIGRMLSYLLPLIMMRNKGHIRNSWQIVKSKEGKTWIEEGLGHPQRRIGYSVAHDDNYEILVIANWTVPLNTSIAGVCNIGLALHEVPRNDGPMVYHQRYRNSLSKAENNAMLILEKSAIIERVCLLMALKKAYFEATCTLATAQDIDWSRLEFNVERSTASFDRQPLVGWEFRLWHLEGLQRTGSDRRSYKPVYLCAFARFSGSLKTVQFTWMSNEEISQAFGEKPSPTIGDLMRAYHKLEE